MKFFRLTVFLVSGYSWGPDGHRIVADIAERLLLPTTRESVSRMLSGSSMSEVANWADEIDHKPEFAWTKCMHYIDASIGRCSVDLNTDCAKGCCVVKAIANYTDQIMRSSLPEDALKFLIHFMGDVHQPLHAGHREDKGGNMIEVSLEFFNSDHKKENLHEIWDSALIKRYLADFDHSWKSYADNISGQIQSGVYVDEAGTCSHYQGGEDCPLSAAVESASLACEYAYIDELAHEIKSGDRLSHVYFETRIKVVEKRLALAGIRLSEILNEIFSKKGDPVMTVEIE